MSSECDLFLPSFPLTVLLYCFCLIHSCHVFFDDVVGTGSSSVSDMDEFESKSSVDIVSVMSFSERMSLISVFESMLFVLLFCEYRWFAY